jgi:hypothetical protein
MHGGRFTGDPAYFKHIREGCKKLMERLNLKPSDINYFVAHQPNVQFPVRVARELGFKEEQYLPSLQVQSSATLIRVLRRGLGSSPRHSKTRRTHFNRKLWFWSWKRRLLAYNNKPDNLKKGNAKN